MPLEGMGGYGSGGTKARPLAAYRRRLCCFWSSIFVLAITSRKIKVQSDPRASDTARPLRHRPPYGQRTRTWASTFRGRVSGLLFCGECESGNLTATRRPLSRTDWTTARARRDQLPQTFQLRPRRNAGASFLPDARDRACAHRRLMSFGGKADIGRHCPLSFKWRREAAALRQEQRRLQSPASILKDSILVR
jgi:hypothetical protein